MKKEQFKRIVILNRGEAAIRFMRAARTLSGIRDESLETVAFYTKPDRAALFVRMATHAVDLGEAMVPGPDGKLRSAYLDIDRMIRLTKEAGATAIWPGWGFLAESAEFAAACEKNDITFIGPSSDAIMLLGDKIRAKALADKHGVPVTKWSESGVEDLETAHKMGEHIGYPLMIKASAGGGGRGIRVVREPDELEQAFESARSEALAAFGCGDVLMEQLVGEARHVEVQVIGDKHGTVWALGTRDCSVQRRHQKLIEEAPAPQLSDEIERGMCEAAVAIAKASKYWGAGTAEFLYEKATGRFFFLEMNTRLQVEHTITEEIYGVDLAVQQILVARGEKLPSEQPPSHRGAAVEVRLNAENPDEGFAPSAGLIARFETPQGPGIRLDSGYAAGDEVPTDFDSNIAKVIAWGANRGEAWARLKAVLRDTVVAIAGGPTNRSLLMELVDNASLKEGPVTTKWLDTYLEERPAIEERAGMPIALAAAAIGDHLRERRGAVLNFSADTQRGLPQRLSAPGPTRLRYLLGKRTLEVGVASLASGKFRVTCGDGSIDLLAVNTGNRTMVLEDADGVRHSVIRIATPTAVHVDVDGVAFSLTRTSDGAVKAPIPAAVTRVHVAPGDRVEVGDRLVTLEVMKMESGVEASQAGVVREVHVDSASRVAAGDPLVTVEEEEGEAATPAEETASPFSTEGSNTAALESVRMALLGYDIDGKELTRAVKMIESGELKASRNELTSLLEIVLLQESLFIRGTFDDARNDSGEASADQLLRFIRNPLGNDDTFSERFKDRLDQFLALHGVSRTKRTFELESAILRLFQGHLEPAQFHELLFALVDAVADADEQGESVEQRAHNRTVLERFAQLAVGMKRRLAQSVWQVIFRLYDRPDMLRIAQEENAEAKRRLAELVAAGLSEEEILDSRESLIEMPLAAIVGLISAHSGEVSGSARTLASILMEHIYEIEPGRIRDESTDQLVRQSFVDEEDVSTCGILVFEDTPMEAVVDACKGAQAVDLFWAPSPTAARVTTLMTGLDGQVERVTLVWSNENQEMKSQTFVRRDGTLVERAMIRDLHPARPVARDLERWQDFDLERLESFPDIFLFLATARDGSGDQRLVALAEVDRFNPVRDGEMNTVAIPAFESVYLHAVYAISEALTTRGLGQSAGGRSNRKRLVWNRISLFYRPVVRLTRHEIEYINAKLSPWAPGLGLEKVSVQARFGMPSKPERRPKKMCVEWSQPTQTASMLNFVRPITAQHRVLSSYQQRVVEARRQGKFYPYELIRVLTSEELGTGFADGEFEELDLSQDGTTLHSVRGRPWGNNEANLVVGRISNTHPRFPEGLERVIIIGDPTRSMGALAEPECARIMGAIDYAEERGLPVEWVPVSSGAKIAFDSGTENLDWTARVLKRIIVFTQSGGVINVIVDGICVGAQSYWNAEATMLNHCRGALIMTGQGCMLLTGRKALEYSGSVSARTNQGIGGLDEIMWPNGEAQYAASDIREAYDILFKHYALTHVPKGHKYVIRQETTDSIERSLDAQPYEGAEGFNSVGEIFSDEHNPGRKRPFAIREVIAAVLDQDISPIERWKGLEGGETSVVYQGQLGGCPVTCIGIESKSVARRGHQPIDGPEAWTSGTLFPHSSRKVARAIHASSGVCPVVVLANLSGFDGSPESMRSRQLEFGAEIGRAVVNFDGPIIFCVISRYHGGAYVVFSQALNPGLEAMALEGSYASVIGGGPAAAVVFPRIVRQRVQADERVQKALNALRGTESHSAVEEAHYEAVLRQVEAEVQAQVAGEFDGIHSVERAQEVGSLSRIISASTLRSELAKAVNLAAERYLSEN